MTVLSLDGFTFLAKCIRKLNLAGRRDDCFWVALHFGFTLKIAPSDLRAFHLLIDKQIVHLKFCKGQNFVQVGVRLSVDGLLVAHNYLAIHCQSEVII